MSKEFRIIDHPVSRFNCRWYIDHLGLVRMSCTGYPWDYSISEFLDRVIKANGEGNGMIQVDDCSTYLREKLRQVIDAEFGIGPMVGWRGK